MCYTELSNPAIDHIYVCVVTPLITHPGNIADHFHSQPLLLTIGGTTHDRIRRCRPPGQITVDLVPLAPDAPCHRDDGPAKARDEDYQLSSTDHRILACIQHMNGTRWRNSLGIAARLVPYECFPIITGCPGPVLLSSL